MAVWKRHQIGSEERQVEPAAGVDYKIEHRSSHPCFNAGTTHLTQLVGGTGPSGSGHWYGFRF